MLRKKVNPIGTVELVSFPDDQITDVPAKVDTGADSSSIWASDISLTDGKLYFIFFGPRSVFHNGTQVVSTAFKTTSVKNSFGHTEFRYKIKLKVKIGKRVIKAWFSLSDRSRNTYPILLGKNILKDRFVVDVSKKFLSSENIPAQEVFVLSNKADELQQFFDKVAAHSQSGARYQCANYDSLLFRISPALVQVISIAPAEADIAQYALVYFKTHVKNTEMAATVAEYLHYKAVPFIDKELGTYTSNSKLSEYLKMACQNLPVPSVICAKTPLLRERFETIKAELGLPFILKEVASDKGLNNYLINTHKDFLSILDAAPEEHLYIAQTYVPNDGFLRVYVFGREIALVIRRKFDTHKDRLRNHLNKPAGGANATLLEPQRLTSDVQDICIRAAECMNRQIAGIDIIQDKITKKWYILEVNTAPQLKGGSFVEEKIRAVANYFDNELSR